MFWLYCSVHSLFVLEVHFPTSFLHTVCICPEYCTWLLESYAAKHILRMW